MAKNWDSYSFKIASHFLSALINGDDSGLSDKDTANLQSFIEDATQNAKSSGFTVGHWASENDDEGNDYGTCAVSKLYAGRSLVQLMVWKDSEPVAATQKNAGAPIMETHRFEHKDRRAARLVNRPDWSETLPWVSYINGTAGRHFASLAAGEAYMTENGFTRF